MQNWHLPIVCVPEGGEAGSVQTASQGLCSLTRNLHQPSLWLFIAAKCRDATGAELAPANNYCMCVLKGRQDMQMVKLNKVSA